MLIGILQEKDSIASKILSDLNVNQEKLYSEIWKILNDYSDDVKHEKKSETNTKTLNQYGMDLTKKAREGRLDPVIRKKERDQ